MRQLGCGNERRMSRRRFHASAAALFAFLTAPGCRSEKPDGNDAATRPESDAEKARSMASVAKGSNMPSSVSVRFTWKSIASGSETPGARSRHCMAYDANSEIIVLFSEIDWANQGRQIGDTWELLARKWSRSDSAINPAARHRGAMVYDPVRGNCLLFGGQGRGQSGFGYSMLDDTWTYANGQWKQWKSLFGSRPSPRCGHALAFDESAGFAVLFGGIAPRDKPLGDTWLFDGKGWKQINGDSPPLRRYAAFAYDPDLRGCVLQGGSEDDNGRRGYGDTWLFRDNRWQCLGDAFEIDPGDDHSLAYHRAAKLLVMSGGLFRGDPLMIRATGGWRRADVSPPLPRYQCSPLVWSDELHGLLLHGGESQHGGRQFSTTWLLEYGNG